MLKLSLRNKKIFFNKSEILCKDSHVIKQIFFGFSNNNTITMNKKGNPNKNIKERDNIKSDGVKKDKNPSSNSNDQDLNRKEKYDKNFFTFKTQNSKVLNTVYNSPSIKLLLKDASTFYQLSKISEKSGMMKSRIYRIKNELKKMNENFNSSIFKDIDKGNFQLLYEDFLASKKDVLDINNQSHLLADNLNYFEGNSNIFSLKYRSLGSRHESFHQEFQKYLNSIILLISKGRFTTELFANLLEKFQKLNKDFLLELTKPQYFYLLIDSTKRNVTFEDKFIMSTLIFMRIDKNKKVSDEDAEILSEINLEETLNNWLDNFITITDFSGMKKTSLPILIEFYSKIFTILKNENHHKYLSIQTLSKTISKFFNKPNAIRTILKINNHLEEDSFLDIIMNEINSIDNKSYLPHGLGIQFIEKLVNEISLNKIKLSNKEYNFLNELLLLNIDFDNLDEQIKEMNLMDSLVNLWQSSTDITKELNIAKTFYILMKIHAKGIDNISIDNITKILNIEKIISSTDSKKLSILHPELYIKRKYK